MSEANKTNCCTPEGGCTLKDDTLHCLFERPAFFSGRCIFSVWESKKCLSPFALTAARMMEAQNERSGS